MSTGFEILRIPIFNGLKFESPILIDRIMVKAPLLNPIYGKISEVNHDQHTQLVMRSFRPGHFITSESLLQTLGKSQTSEKYGLCRWSLM